MEEERSEAILSMHSSWAVLAEATPMGGGKQLINEEEMKVRNIWSN